MSDGEDLERGLLLAVAEVLSSVVAGRAGSNRWNTLWACSGVSSIAGP